MAILSARVARWAIWEGLERRILEGMAGEGKEGITRADITRN